MKVHRALEKVGAVPGQLCSSSLRPFSTTGKQFTEKDAERLQYRLQKVYKLGGADKFAVTMHPESNKDLIKGIDNRLVADNKYEGFKYAYQKFVESYAKRKFETLDQMCEPKLAAAIRDEPLTHYFGQRDDELDENQAQWQAAANLESEEKVCDFELVDFHVNLGLKQDRQFNHDFDMKEHHLPFLLGSLFRSNQLKTYYPSNVFTMWKNIKYGKDLAMAIMGRKSGMKSLVLENMLLECHLRINTNVVVCHEKERLAQMEANPELTETHFFKFESDIRGIEINFEEYRQREGKWFDKLRKMIMEEVELDAWTIADVDNFLKGNPPVV